MNQSMIKFSWSKLNQTDINSEPPLFRRGFNPWTDSGHQLVGIPSSIFGIIRNVVEISPISALVLSSNISGGGSIGTRDSISLS